MARQFLFDLLYHALLLVMLRALPFGCSEGCAAVRHRRCSVCMFFLRLFFVLPRQLFLYLLRQPFLLPSSALPVVFRLHTILTFVFIS